MLTALFIVCVLGLTLCFVTLILAFASLGALTKIEGHVARLRALVVVTGDETKSTTDGIRERTN